MAKPENMNIVTSPSLASLHSYVGEILKSTNMDNAIERMKNEWARYITFGSFPRSSPVQPTRLAQSGFYYSGTRDETICFSCGLKYNNWKEGDSPFDVHKKLSPSCDFVNGSGDGNMPIRRRSTDFAHSACSVTGHEDKDDPVSQNNITETVNSDNRHKNKNKLELFSAVDRTVNNEQSMNDMNAWNNDLRSNSSFTSKSFVQEKGKESENNKRSLSERPKEQPVMFQDNIKIAECLEKPKHQHYSVLTSRLESFRGWPSYLRQKPADLATAGFYYVDHGTFLATDLMEIIFELEENSTEDSDSSRCSTRVSTEATMQHKVTKPKELSVDKNEQSDNDSKLMHKSYAEKKKNDPSSRSSISPEELESLLEQNQELKDQATCKICMDREACIVFLPCCHMMACPQCAPSLRKCPVCRQLIRGTVRAYIS